MKSILVFCFLSFFLKSIVAQQNNSVVIGGIDSIYSTILKEKRKIWVHLPASYRSDIAAKNKYPVIYLLDAEWNFTSVVGMTDLLSSVNGNDFWPEMIVVGIPNTDRLRDLTPTRVTEGLWIDSSTARRSGGGEAFLSFFEKELIPHIDSLYPTTAYRILIGHSLGGLTAINALVHHKNLFNGFVVIEPSMWWDKQRLLHETEQTLKTNSYTGTALFLGMAHTQSAGMDTTEVQSDTSEGTLHPRSILQLGKYIMKNSQNDLKANFRYYDEETHSSVPVMTTYDALHFIFKDYQLKFQDSYFTDSSFKLASFLKTHYEKITSEYGITLDDGRPLLPPEDLVNNMGYFAFTKQQFNKAEDLFKMNVKNYPGSYQTYNLLGDLYAAKGDWSKALASYKKSLSLKTDPEITKKLEKLEGNRDLNPAKSKPGDH